jgi:hypothetical protein
MSMQRLARLSGIPAVVLIAAGFSASGATPREDAPVDKLVSFYNEHDTGQIVSGVLVSLGALLFLLFASALVDVFRRSETESRTLAALSYGGALLFTAGLTVGAGLSVFIGGTVSDLEPAALQALHVASLIVIFPISIGASAFFLGAGFEVLRTQLLPAWLGWSAVVLGVVAAIPSHVLGGALDHIGIIPVTGLGIWTLVVSVLLTRRAAV